MAGAGGSLNVRGFSHPPNIKPVEHNGTVTWHKVECPVPNGKCLDAPLKMGCASAPKPEEQ